MSLEFFASLAEIVGVILVVASLVYVARQLQQTATMMRVSASTERIQRDADITNSIIHSREIAEYWMKGAANFESLDEVDQQRLIFFERRALLHWYNMFALHEQDLVPESDWFELKWIIQNVGRRQAIREAWKIFKGSYEQPFQDFVEQQFAVADSQVTQNLSG